MSQTTLVPDRSSTFDNIGPGRVAQGDVTIEATRPRQTTPPPTPFRDILAGGASLLGGGDE